MSKILILFALIVVASSIPQFYTQMKDNFGAKTFNLNGDWQFLSTNCTDIPLCRPQLKIVQAQDQSKDQSQVGQQSQVQPQPQGQSENTSSTQNGRNRSQIGVDAEFVFVFPNDDSCGDRKGQQLSRKERVAYGIFDDEDSNSPLYKFKTILLLNNMTLAVDRPDIKDKTLMCRDLFSGHDFYATNISDSDAGKLIQNWEGVWAIKKIFCNHENMDLCVPDREDIFVKLSEDKQSGLFVTHFPKCDVCKDLSDKVFARNASILGGGARDIQKDFSVSSYLVDKDVQVIVVDGQYALLTVRQDPIDCKATIQNIIEASKNIMQNQQSQNQTVPVQNQTQP